MRAPGATRGIPATTWDVAAAVLVQLEGQDGHPGSGEEPPCYFSPAPGATGRIRATTCRAPAAQVARATALLAVAEGQSYTAAAKQVGRRNGDTVALWVARFNRRSG